MPRATRVGRHCRRAAGPAGIFRPTAQPAGTTGRRAGSRSDNGKSSRQRMTGTAMLEKTLAMLAEVRPGSYLPDDVASYDPAELDAFGRVLSRLLYSPSSLRRLLQQKFGVTITRADAYGEIPTITELERSFAAPSLLTLDGIFPGNAEMVAELERLMKVSHEFDPPQTSSRAGEYAWQNGAFSFSDAVAYFPMNSTRRTRT